MLIYDDPSGIMSIILSNINGIIGFDAGDQFRSAIIISRRNRNNSILNNTNIFRIDGKQAMIYQSASLFFSYIIVI